MEIEVPVAFRRWYSARGAASSEVVMSFLFGGAKPTPQPLPTSPTDSAEAERKRQDAERAAVSERVSAGKRSTIVAGQQIAMEEQAGTGLLSQTRRRAGRELVG